jgi:hypothetical protein
LIEKLDYENIFWYCFYVLTKLYEIGDMMKKKILIPVMGVAVIGFVGCTDVPAPEYNVPSPAPTQMNNQGKMVNYCRGMIAGEVNTKPMYVKMGSVVAQQGAVTASTVSGTVDGKKYTCEFNKNGEYLNVYPN